MIQGDPKHLLGKWRIEYKRERTGIEIPGSPERCLHRTIVEDARGRCFVLESIPDRKLGLKRNIARILNGLHNRGMCTIVPYMKSDSEDHLVRYSNRWWQLSPYFPGIDLDRPNYVYDKWRGRVLAAFLIELGRKSVGLQKAPEEKVFSIVAYIDHLVRTIKRHASATMPVFKPALQFLRKRFFEAHEKMPIRFCHGDYHPLNVIWGRSQIRAVIDWEFSGFKAEIYDVANLIGCIGIEDPESLAGDLVIAFIERMKEKSGISELSWRYLPEFMIAVRFAWLSEWLRKNDTEMIAMEGAYLKILVQHRGLLKECWDL